MAKERAKSQEAHAFMRQRVETLYNKGLSRSQICERLCLTKGQVDGVLYKHLLRKLVPAGNDTTFVAPRSGPRNRPSTPGVLDGVLPVEVSFDPPPGKFNIYNIKNFQCRWLKEDGYFCGDATQPLRSYCDHHHALCWVKTRKQQQDAALRPINS